MNVWAALEAVPEFNERIAIGRAQLAVGEKVLFEIDQDPEELPDDQIVPDNTDPLPPDPEVKTDPVDDE